MAVEQVFTASAAGRVRVEPTLAGATVVTVVVSDPAHTVQFATGSGPVEIEVARGATVTLDSGSPGAISYRQTVERTATSLTLDFYRYIEPTDGWIES